MRTLKLVFTLFLSFTFMFEANAQSKESKKTIRQADKFYDGENFKPAALLYKQVIKEMKSDAEINYKLGYSLLYTNDKKKSLPYFEQAYRLNNEVDDQIMLSLARAYHLNHHFDDALKYYDTQVLSKVKSQIVQIWSFKPFETAGKMLPC